ncbi:hypothetical protein ACLESD_20035 [Pyxidicoccus sp. 3LFB2]
MSDWRTMRTLLTWSSSRQLSGKKSKAERRWMPASSRWMLNVRLSGKPR